MNSRDLETLTVDLERALSLSDGAAGVDARPGERRVEPRRRDPGEEAGADAVLVGEALMRAADPAAKLRELLAHRP